MTKTITISRDSNKLLNVQKLMNLLRTVRWPRPITFWYRSMEIYSIWCFSSWNLSFSFCICCFALLFYYFIMDYSAFTLLATGFRRRTIIICYRIYCYEFLSIWYKVDQPIPINNSTPNKSFQVRLVPILCLLLELTWRNRLKFSITMSRMYDSFLPPKRKVERLCWFMDLIILESIPTLHLSHKWCFRLRAMIAWKHIVHIIAVLRKDIVSFFTPISSFC